MKKLTKRSKKGFTLVELIVVIAILAILAGVAIPVYSNYISKANEAADLTLLDSVKTAVVFAATEERIPEAATVIEITVDTDATKVKAKLAEKNDSNANIELELDISSYIGSDTLEFKSDTYESGATWSAEENKWEGAASSSDTSTDTPPAEEP